MASGIDINSNDDKKGKGSMKVEVTSGDTEASAGKKKESEQKESKPEQASSNNKDDENEAFMTTEAAESSAEKSSPESKTAATPHQDKAAEYLDMLQRLKAEFDNYRRRTKKEKADTIVYACEGVVEKILPILDNLQRGIEFSRKSGISDDLLKGITMVEKQLLDLLAEYGVQPFESLGQKFDPNVHEPMHVLERDDVDEDTVIEEFQRGYKIHDKLLRVAKVVISRGPRQDG